MAVGQITWEQFITSNNDARGVNYKFEDLIRQLFTYEFLSRNHMFKYVHSNPNNPGIESEPILDEVNNRYIGYQAKFFDNDRNMYNQIKESAKKAVEHYQGKLDLIYLFCNKPLTTTCNSYKDIEKLLNDAGIKLQPITDTTILDLVRKYPMLGKYYFDEHSISHEWFVNKADIITNILGERFNADFNVDTEASRNLSIFLQDHNALDYYNNKKRKLIEEIVSLRWELDSDGLYKYACKVTARRFFPNFINLDASFNKHPKWKENDPNRYYYECATMGCRTRVFGNRHGEDTSVGRGNLSFTTVNIVRIAIESAKEAQENLGLNFDLGKDSEQYMTEKYNKEVKKIFLNKLEKYTDITARQLYDRYKFQCTAVAKQFPLLMAGMWQDSEKLKPNDKIESVLKHGTLGIGFIGLAECLTVLTGKHHAESEKSQKLGVEIITQMKESCDRYSDRYNLNYSLLATPAEGLSGRFTNIDRKDFGTILGVTDKDYYTNSNHVPVWYKCTAEEKAKIEAPYHELTLGGHIFYIELDGDATHNPKSVEAVVDLMDKYNMGYGSINHTRSRCLDCGFENADSSLKKCPLCGGENIDTIQRITGYLVGTTSRWNKGKLAELHDRVTHN